MGCSTSKKQSERPLILPMITFKKTNNPEIDILFDEIKEFIQYSDIIIHRLDAFKKQGFQIRSFTQKEKHHLVDVVTNSPKKLENVLEEI